MLAMLTISQVYLIAAHSHRSHRTVQRLYDRDPRVQEFAREAITAAATELEIELPPHPNERRKAA